LVLNLNNGLTELNKLNHRRQAALARPGYQLPAPLVNEAPLDEIGKKERLFAMAFPSLHPYGQGDYYEGPQRTVTLAEYRKHVLVNPTIFQRYHVLRRDVRVNRDHVTVHLRNSKVDRDKQGMYICMARTSDSICPVTALEQLFLVDTRPRMPLGPLFRFINRGFRRQDVINRIKTLLALSTAYARERPRMPSISGIVGDFA
jgi:hypothetical protein